MQAHVQTTELSNLQLSSQGPPSYTHRLDWPSSWPFLVQLMYNDKKAPSCSKLFYVYCRCWDIKYSLPGCVIRSVYVHNLFVNATLVHWNYEPVMGPTTKTCSRVNSFSLFTSKWICASVFNLFLPLAKRQRVTASYVFEIIRGCTRVHILRGRPCISNIDLEESWIGFLIVVFIKRFRSGV